MYALFYFLFSLFLSFYLILKHHICVIYLSSLCASLCICSFISLQNTCCSTKVALPLEVSVVSDNVLLFCNNAYHCLPDVAASS